MSVLGLASKRLLPLDTPLPVSMAGWMDISNIVFQDATSRTIPTGGSATDPTTWVEASTIAGGNPVYIQSIQQGKNSLIECLLYCRSSSTGLDGIGLGLRYYLSGVPVRSAGIVGMIDTTDLFSIRFSDATDGEEADECRIIVWTNKSGSQFGGNAGGSPNNGGLWRIISTG